MNILITGGAGYIGAHVVDLLHKRGDTPIIVDDLSTGILEKIKNTKLYIINLSENNNVVKKLTNIMHDHKISAVIHFAAKKQVGESVEKPMWYYDQNVIGMINLLTAIKETKIKKFVFSSSAATFGIPDTPIVNEEYPCSPINPYGETKLIGEWMTKSLAKTSNLRIANLRYFNVAGAGKPEFMDTAIMNLIPIVFECLEKNKRPKIFGDDYSTSDGTCIRDYIHVVDLAEAHISALNYLDKEKREFFDFNVGTGKGSSVMQVLDSIKKITKLDINPNIAPRRIGDPPQLIANVERIAKTFGWKAKYNLDDIIQSTWDAMKYRGTNLF